MRASTIGHAIGLGVCRYVAPAEMPRFVRALNTMAHSVDEMLANARAMPEDAGSHGATALDHVLPGEAVIVFSDANPRHGYAAAQIGVGELTRAWEASEDAVDRRAHAIKTALRIGATLRLERSAEARHADVVDLAAHLLTTADVGRLSNMPEGLPVIAIVGDTTPDTWPQNPFYLAVECLGGEWLGLSQAAGRA